MTEFSLIQDKNEIFEIIVYSSGSSGYLWKVIDLPDKMELVEKKISDAEIPGNATKDLYKFRSEQVGEYKIHFVLARPWEKFGIDEMFYKVIVK